MAGSRTEITEIVTGLGTLGGDLESYLVARPEQLVYVPDAVWQGIVLAYDEPANRQLFASAFESGVAFLRALDGLRGRVPRLVEWKGPNRPPGDDVIPADLRVDHVFQISCKFLSKILQNCGPARLFERNLVGEQRTAHDWFAVTAGSQYQTFYEAVRRAFVNELPPEVTSLRRPDRTVLKQVLRPRELPPDLRPAWAELCTAVSRESAARWKANLTSQRARLRMLWRLLRIGDAPYFILGAADGGRLRLRVASAWDWMQQFDLRRFEVQPQRAGQPQVAWHAEVVERRAGSLRVIDGHVEIRWSHGRFQGSPEAKIYLDTPHSAVPGFFALT